MLNTTTSAFRVDSISYTYLVESKTSTSPPHHFSSPFIIREQKSLQTASLLEQQQPWPPEQQRTSLRYVHTLLIPEQRQQIAHTDTSFPGLRPRSGHDQIHQTSRQSRLHRTRIRSWHQSLDRRTSKLRPNRRRCSLLLLWRLNMRTTSILPVRNDSNPHLQCQQQLLHWLDRSPPRTNDDRRRYGRCSSRCWI